MSVSTAGTPGAHPLTSRRRSNLREVQGEGGWVIELATSRGVLPAVLLWVPVAVLSGLALYELVLQFFPPSHVVACASIAFVLAAETIVLLRSWRYRPLARIVLSAGGLVLGSSRQRANEGSVDRVRISLDEIRGVRVFQDANGKARGIDIFRIDAVPLQIRGWDPTEDEAILVRDRLSYLIENLRRAPYRPRS